MATLPIVSFVLWSTGLLTLALFGLIAYDSRRVQTPHRAQPRLRVVARQSVMPAARELPEAA